MNRAFLGAEWVKLRTVRSTGLTLLIAAVAAVGVGALGSDRFAAHVLAQPDRLDRLRMVSGFDPATQSLQGNALAQLAIATLGALFVTSEFGTGMIRASLAAMPQRRRWYLAKLAVFGSVVTIVGQLLSVTSFLVGQAFLHRAHLGVSLGDATSIRTVVTTGLYVTLIGLLGAAVGMIVRHTAGALTTVLGMLFVLPGLASAFPRSTELAIDRLLPENIGEQAATLTQLQHHLGPWTGLAVLAGYVVVLVVIGERLLQRRDL